MPSPSKLFLKFSNIDGKYHVNDEDGFAFGMAYEIPDAIQHARTVSNATINIGGSYAGFEEVCLPEKPEDAEEDDETFMAMLAELAGVKIIKCYDDNLHFKGYRMERIE